MIFISQTRANALEINLVQGFAYHYNEYVEYNDSVFKDNKTSTNTLLTLSHNKFSFAVLSDSQGDLSTALYYSQGVYKNKRNYLNTVVGIYNIRSDKIFSTSPNLISFPSFNIGRREFHITPLAGLEYSYQINKDVSFSALITPAFTLVGLKLKVF